MDLAGRPSSRRGGTAYRLTGAAIVLAVLTGCGETGVPRIKNTAHPNPPIRGAYFGAYVEPPPAEYNQAGQVNIVKRRERRLGRQFDIAHSYRKWHEPFPRAADTVFLNSSRYLLLSWNGTDTRRVASGQEDSTIRARAQAIKATGKPIFLRWRWEMDRPNIRNVIHSPADYIAAWRHIRKIFTAEGVRNVAWVWCPTAKGFPGAAAYYPGDDQVDWVCADAYPGYQYAYRDLSDEMGPFLEWAAKRPKPIMIGEFGVPRIYGPRRPEWLRKAAEVLRNPQIKAIVYYDSDQQGKGHGQELQYALDGDPAAMSAMRELATTPHFNPRNLAVPPAE